MVAAGVATGVAIERRLVRRARVPGHPTMAFGSLRGEVRRVRTGDDVTLYAEVDQPDEQGPPGRPAIVFVHGYALNLDCWHFQREALRGNHRLVFYDQRSHGRSGRSRREHCTVPQLGVDLAAVVEQLVPDGPVILVGHSLGAMTILALAGQYPELFGTRIVGVGLITTSAGGLSTSRLGLPGLPGRLVHQVAPALLATLARAPRLVERGRRAGSDLGFALTQRLAFGSEVPDEFVDFTDEMLSATPFEVIVDFFPSFAAYDEYAALQTLAWVPTVVIGGGRDAITPILHSLRIVEQIPAAELVEIPEAGHMVILERPDDVNQALLSMIGRAERSARE